MSKTDSIEEMIDKAIVKALKKLSIEVTANRDYGGGGLEIKLFHGKTLLDSDNVSASRLQALTENSDEYDY